MTKSFFDTYDAALREVVRYELTQVTGSLEYRITHLIEALKGREMIVKTWENRLRQQKKWKKR